MKIPTLEAHCSVGEASSPAGFGRWVWCSWTLRSAAGCRTGRRSGRCACRAAAGSDSRTPSSSPSRRDRRGRRRGWGAPRPRRSRTRSPATAARRGPAPGTWGTLSPDTPRPPRGYDGPPSRGSRARGRSAGRPRAASRPGRLCGEGWGRPACWSRPDTAAARRSAPAAGPPGVWRWGCATDPQPSATAGWRRTGRWASRPSARYTQSPPEGETSRLQVNHNNTETPHPVSIHLLSRLSQWRPWRGFFSLSE